MNKKLTTYDLHVITEDIFWYEFEASFAYFFCCCYCKCQKKKRGEGLVKAYEGRGSAS